MLEASATRGPGRGLFSDSVVDSLVIADGPCAGDWEHDDRVCTAPIRSSHAGEFFTHMGKDEIVTFAA